LALRLALARVSRRLRLDALLIPVPIRWLELEARSLEPSESGHLDGTLALLRAVLEDLGIGCAVVTALDSELGVGTPRDRQGACRSMLPSDDRVPRTVPLRCRFRRKRFDRGDRQCETADEQRGEQYSAPFHERRFQRFLEWADAETSHICFRSGPLARNTAV